MSNAGAPEPATIVRRYAEAWLAGDLATVFALYADDLTLHWGGRHALAGDHVGRDASLAALARLQALTNRRPVAVHDVLAGRDTAAAWVRERWERDGRAVEIDRFLVYRTHAANGGQLAECWVYDTAPELVDEWLAEAPPS